MTLPDPHSLALFVRAAESGSLTKAAEASNIALAAASRRIAMLEHHYRASLLQRSSRGVELTQAGQALFDMAKECLVRLNQMGEQMAEYSTLRRDVLRIAATMSALAETCPQELGRFRRLHPNVRILVEEMRSSEAIEALRASKVDLAIVFEGPPLDGLECRPYRMDTLAAVLPAGHRAAGSGSLRFDEIAGESIVGLTGWPNMMGLLREQAALLGIPLRVDAYLRSFEGACTMVREGFGIGIMPLQAVSGRNQQLMQLQLRPLSEPWATRRMLLCVKSGRVRSEPLLKLMDTLGSGGD